MNLFQMKCPNCGADLEIEDGIDSFYCKYCGTKIVLEGQSDEVLKTKRRVKLMDKAHEMQKEYYKEKARQDKQRRQQELEDAEAQSGSGWVMLILIALIVAIFIGSNISSNMKEKRETERLNIIYSEIQTDISNKNYDSALVKANSLRWGLDGSDKKAQWDNTREDLIVLINDLKEEN